LFHYFFGRGSEETLNLVLLLALLLANIFLPEAEEEEDPVKDLPALDDTPPKESSEPEKDSEAPAEDEQTS